MFHIDHSLFLECKILKMFCISWHRGQNGMDDLHEALPFCLLVPGSRGHGLWAGPLWPGLAGAAAVQWLQELSD